MRISLLLEREPFGSVLEKTLARFLDARHGAAHRVEWSSALAGRWPPSVAQTWICNPYLNGIFVPGVDRRALEPLRREFARSTVPWRRPLQSAYFACVDRPILARLLARAAVEIDPAVPRSREQVIVGGNHKIRILDVGEGRAYAIRKDGFAGRRLEAELNGRARAAEAGVPVPRIEEVASDRSWFAEQFLAGTPLTRLGDRARAGVVRDAAFVALGRLHRATARTVASDDYRQHLARRGRELIAMAPVLDGEWRSRSERALERVVESVRTSATDDGVEVALTHGDMQPANVLSDGDRFWLIDWEYAGERQVAYDGLVYHLRARSPVGLADRIRSAAASSVEIPGIPRSPGGYDPTLKLFLLENLVLQLEETDNPLFRTPDRGFAGFLRELETLFETWLQEG